LTVDIRFMARQDQQQPWWERPARSPGEPEYVREREQLRAELARAWRADGEERDPRKFDPRSRPAAA
jgi:hypothetical protein